MDPFTSALSDYAAHHTMPQFQHCVVCFSHIYAQELPERRIRDYDNLELKQFLDVAASFILTDDNGLLCDATTPRSWAKRIAHGFFSWTARSFRPGLQSARMV